MNYDQNQSVDLAAAIAAITNKPSRQRTAKLESWVQGPRSIAATLDSGIQAHKLEIIYWRVHKIGWFRVRVVYGVRGPVERVKAFQAALAKWVGDNQA